MNARLLVLVPAAVLTLAGCTSGGDDPGGKGQTAGGRRVPLQVVEGENGATLLFAPVKIDGKGPFRFTLDTGASHSSISTKLAAQLGLKKTGESAQVTGVAGSEQAQGVAVSKWQVGKVSLDPLTLFALDFPGSADQGPAGLLGSDVLSDFPSVAIDYQARTLTLGGTVAGGGEKVKLKVLSPTGAHTLAFAPVFVGGKGPIPFTLDTGASSSTISKSAAQKLGLQPTGESEQVNGVASRERAVGVRVDTWRVGGHRLEPQTLFALEFPHAERTIVAGLLGSDVLSGFAAIAIDYQAETLTLRTKQ